MSEKTKDPRHDNMEKILHETLVEQKKLRVRLMMRKALKRNFKDEWERNEHEILLIDTNGRIAAINKSIYNKEQYFIMYMQQFIRDLEECDKHLENIVNKANASMEPMVKKMLAEVNWQAFEEKDIVKIVFYKKFKDKV